MALAIVVGSVLLLVILGIVGLWRGVPRGLLSLMSTLLGATLVDVWITTWGARVQSWLRLERQQTSTWLAATVGFLIVALFIGYGSGLLVPQKVNDAVAKARLRILAGPLAVLLGVLNGALIVGYLLIYATEFLRRNDITAAIQGSPVLRAFTTWLPWFLMAVVLSTGVLVLARMVVALTRFISTPKTPAKQPVAPTAPAASAIPAASAAPAVAAAPAASATPASTSVAAQPTAAAKLGAVSNKIDQALGEKK